MKKPAYNPMEGLSDFEILALLRQHGNYDGAEYVIDAYVSCWEKRQELVNAFFNNVFFPEAIPSKELAIPIKVFEQIRQAFLSLQHSHTDAINEIATLNKSLRECKDACDRANNRIRLQYLAEKSHLSASSLAEIRIPGFPHTKQGINKIAKTENWPFRTVKGKGGMTREYAVDKLPPHRRDAIRCWHKWSYLYG